MSCKSPLRTFWVNVSLCSYISISWSRIRWIYIPNVPKLIYVFDLYDTVYCLCILITSLVMKNANTESSMDMEVNKEFQLLSCPGLPNVLVILPLLFCDERHNILNQFSWFLFIKFLAYHNSSCSNTTPLIQEHIPYSMLKLYIQNFMSAWTLPILDLWPFLQIMLHCLGTLVHRVEYKSHGIYFSEKLVWWGGNWEWYIIEATSSLVTSVALPVFWPWMPEPKLTSEWSSKAIAPQANDKMEDRSQR